MAKKTAKRKGPATPAAIEDAKRQREREVLRRAKDHQRRVTMLARSLARATQTADIWRLNVARNLCVGSGFFLMGDGEAARLQARAAEGVRVAEELAARVQELEAEKRDREPVGVGNSR